MGTPEQDRIAHEEEVRAERERSMARHPSNQGPIWPDYQGVGPPRETTKNSFASSGMVIGIVGASLGLFPFISMVSIVLGFVGLPLSGVGFWKSLKSDVGKGQAITGVVLNLVAIVLWFGWAMIWGSALAEV